jgi:hypothetical protein
VKLSVSKKIRQPWWWLEIWHKRRLLAIHGVGVHHHHHHRHHQIIRTIRGCNLRFIPPRYQVDNRKLSWAWLSWAWLDWAGLLLGLQLVVKVPRLSWSYFNGWKKRERGGGFSLGTSFYNRAFRRIWIRYWIVSDGWISSNQSTVLVHLVNTLVRLRIRIPTSLWFFIGSSLVRLFYVVLKAKILF